MPKIRGIKPDFWTDEAIADLSIPARLLFIGLWNYACDNGHLQDKPKQIKMRLLPADDVNVSELLRELVDKGRLIRQDGWLTIPNLGSHQKIDSRYFTTCDKADCDDPPEKVSKRETRRAPTGTHGHTRVPTFAQGDCDLIDGDGDGDLSPQAPTSRKRSTSLPKSWKPNDAHVAFAATSGLNLAREVETFRDYHLAKGSSYRDWDATFRNWLRKGVEFGRGRGSNTSRALRTVNDIEQPPDGLSPAEYAKWDHQQRIKRGVS